MEMTNPEILRSYQEAKNKREQVKILAQLNLCSQEAIVEILKEMGADGRQLPRLTPKKQEATSDAVDHPDYYADGKIEPIDFIEDKRLSFCRGNAVKYISRAGKKDPTKEIEDLEKAKWYLQREIDYLKRQKEEATQ
jgi:hypothetical protein